MCDYICSIEQSIRNLFLSILSLLKNMALKVLDIPGYVTGLIEGDGVLVPIIYLVCFFGVLYVFVKILRTILVHIFQIIHPFFRVFIALMIVTSILLRVFNPVFSGAEVIVPFSSSEFDSWLDAISICERKFHYLTLYFLLFFIFMSSFRQCESCGSFLIKETGKEYMRTESRAVTATVDDRPETRYEDVDIYDVTYRCNRCQHSWSEEE